MIVISYQCYTIPDSTFQWNPFAIRCEYSDLHSVSRLHALLCAYPKVHFSTHPVYPVTHDFLLWGVKDRVLPYAFSFCEVFLRSYKNIKKYTHFSVLYEEYYRFIFATVLKLILLNILRYTKQTTLPLQWFLVITIWSCLPREYRPDVKLISPIFWRARPFIRQWWAL